MRAITGENWYLPAASQRLTILDMRNLGDRRGGRSYAKGWQEEAPVTTTTKDIRAHIDNLLSERILR